MEEFTAYTVERIKGKKQADIEDAYHSQEITN